VAHIACGPPAADEDQVDFARSCEVGGAVPTFFAAPSAFGAASPIIGAAVTFNNRKLAEFVVIDRADAFYYKEQLEKERLERETA
jgi:hypothetical protein